MNAIEKAIMIHLADKLSERGMCSLDGEQLSVVRALYSYLSVYRLGGMVWVGDIMVADGQVECLMNNDKRMYRIFLDYADPDLVGKVVELFEKPKR